jgi:CRP-like cAMP-binding protein
MRERTYEAGETIDTTTGALCFVVEGKAEQQVDGRTVKILNPGDFFGQEQEVLETKISVRVRALETTRVYICDPVTTHNVPVMRWRLLENYRRRVFSLAAE